MTTADRYISLQEWVKECKKPGFAAAISKAEVAAKALAAAKDAEFARKGRALGKYFGPDSDNVRLLSNPNAFEPGAGYYFHNVLPDKWVMRDKVLCHTENISLRNQVSSDLFLIFIEDPDLRRAFTPWELPIVAGKEMILGYDVILQAYDESVATTWPSFKLVAMRPAKPTMGF